MIYFIQETGLFRNRVKIGITDNIKGRLSGLRGGSPSALKVLLILPGDIKIETVYHERFAKYRLHGEWFKFGLKLRLFIWINQYKVFAVETPEITILENGTSQDTENPADLSFVVSVDNFISDRYSAEE